MQLIIDTDAGVDDAQALLMALAHPGATVAAITTLTGNVHLDWVVRNVFTVLDVTRQDAPVFRGADQPLVPGFWQPEVRVHGEDGLGNYARRPKTQRTLEAEPAAVALVRLANESPGVYSLVALGPLTNIALACRLDPTFPHKIKEFIFMGGTVSAVGNTATPTAEFNFFCDPEAAVITLDAFPRSTMISWEATLQHPFTWEQYDALIAHDAVGGQFIKDTTLTTVTYLRSNKGLRSDGYLLPDPLAMAVVLEPDIVTASEDRFVTVETQGRHTRGQGVVDYGNAWGRDPNVRIITAVDAARLYALFEQAARYNELLGE